MGTAQLEKICKDGLTVKMDTIVCQTHKETHENCVGCESYEGCKEYLARFGQYVTAELKATGEIPESFEWKTE